MHRRRLGVLTALCAVTGLALGLVPASPSAEAAGPLSSTLRRTSVPTVPLAETGSQPNIVLITADDMRADDLEFMPRTKRLLGKAGVTFTDAISNYPLCCPARATLLSGQYSHNNGVQGNEYPYGGHKKFVETGGDLETLPVWLKRVGYNTGFIGKYLNYYGTGNEQQASTGPHYIPPGWDDWHASVGRVFQYYCVRLNHNGQLRRHPGYYQTDLYTDLSEKFIRRYAGAGQPFFLWASQLAPHLGVTPAKDDYCGSAPGLPTPAAERHRRMFAGIPLPDSPAVNEADMSDKGTYMNERAELDLAKMRASHEGRIESLQSLDESVARTVEVLDEQGVLDNTLIIFTSDNGWLLGEHRAEKKILPYEESLRVPLLMRGPGLPADVRRHQPVGLVDIPATALDVAGATATKPQDGTSLEPLVHDPSLLSRRVMPIEAGPAPGIQRKHNVVLPPWLYRGVRSSRYSYIAWQMTGSEEEEFYDLDEDPFQLESRHAQQSAALRTARTYSEQLRDCVGATCVQELPASTEDGLPRPRRGGDTTAPRVRNVQAPKGWIRTARPTINYTATDPTDPARRLSHWCSHQALGCDGKATLRLPGEGRHSWTIHVTDPAGNVGSRFGDLAVDLFRPRVAVKGERDRVVNRGVAPVRWRVVDTASGVVDVDTRLRRASLAGGFSSWRYPARLQDRARPVRRTAVPAGNGTVCLQVRARDLVGRQRGWTAQSCRSRAVDAASLAPQFPWRSVTRDGWYERTATVTKVRGARIVVPSAGGVGLVRVVARTGPGMGLLRVDVGGSFLARINLDQPERGLQEFVLPTPGRSGEVALRVLSDGLPVWVDSVGVVRRPGL